MPGCPGLSHASCRGLRRGKQASQSALVVRAPASPCKGGGSGVMAFCSVRVCRHAREVSCPISSSARRQEVFRRGLLGSLLLGGASVLAIAASDGARAQQTQLPELTVEASKPKGKKKPAPAKSPSPQVAPVTAPQPQPPPAATTAAVAASDVPYTVPAGVSVVTSEDLARSGAEISIARCALSPAPSRE